MAAPWTTQETIDVTAPSADSPRPRPQGSRLARTVLACALAVTPSLTMPAHAADVPAPTAHYDMSHSGDTLLDVSTMTGPNQA